MKINSILLRYLKYSFIIGIILLFVLSTYFLALKNNYNEMYEDLKVTTSQGLTEGSTIAHYDPYYHDFYFSTVLGADFFERELIHLNTEFSNIILTSTGFALYVLAILLYIDERNSSKHFFLNSLPVKKEKKYLYKWIAALVVTVFTTASALLFIYLFKDFFLAPELSKNASRLMSIYNNIYKDSILSIFIALIIFSVVNVYMNIFGDSSFAWLMFILSGFGFIISVKGSADFLSTYNLCSLDKFYIFFDPVLNIIEKLYRFDIVFALIIIFALVGFLAYLKAPNENNGSLFMFKWVKYAAYIAVFFMGGICSFLFLLSTQFRITIEANILNGSAIIIMGGLLSIWLIKKFECKKINN